MRGFLFSYQQESLNLGDAPGSTATGPSMSDFHLIPTRMIPEAEEYKVYNDMVLEDYIIAVRRLK